MLFLNPYKYFFNACRAVILVFLLSAPALKLHSQTTSDSIIMSAMRDELFRNLNSLNAENPEFLRFQEPDNFWNKIGFEGIPGCQNCLFPDFQVLIVQHFNYIRIVFRLWHQAKNF